MATMGRRTAVEYESVTLQAGDLEIQVTRAPIEAVIGAIALDAVVSSDDSSLSMSGGVARAIRELGGEALKAEARRFAPVPVGEVRVTTGGAMRVKYVLHAATADWARHTPLLPTGRTVRQLAREIFVRCEALEIRRLAIPAIAAGAAGLSPAESAHQIAQVLLHHEANISVLERVVFTIPDPDAFRAFEGELTTIAGELGLWQVGATGEAAAGAPPAAGAPGPAPVGPEDTAATPDSTWRTAAAGWLKHVLPASRDRTRTTRARRDAALLPRDRAAASEAENLVTGATLRLAEQHTDHDCRPLVGERYVLLEEIGRGGLGVVYMAWDLILRHVVAIKRLRDDVTSTETLKREAAIAMQLSHEGIVRVYHFEPRPEQGGPYLVVEYVPWSTGEKWISDAGAGGLPVGAVLEVGTQICQALDYAHSRGVLHLDIKPGNIFVDPAGERAKLSDFGLARVVTPSGQRALQTNVAGTPAYMAPEQMVPGGKLSATTDVYQLAATLWDLLTGRPPTGAREDEETRETELGRALRLLRPVLAPDPARRPADARGFSTALAGVLAAL